MRQESKTQGSVPHRRRGYRTGTWIAALVALSAALGACGSSSGTSGTSAAAGTGAANTSASRTTSAKLKVAVLSIGTTNDRSLAQAMFEGGTEASKKFGIPVKIVQNQVTPQDYLSTGSSYARAGYNFIMLDFGGAYSPALQLAKQFPKVKWAVPVDPTPKEQGTLPPNLITWDPAQQDGAFLAGALAALISKTHVVASIVGAPFPLLNRQPEAFNLGARCVRPTTKVLETFDGDATYSNPALAKTAALSKMGQGADVLYAVFDGGSNGVFAAAKSKPNTYAIAQYFDQASKAPDVILASVLYNFQGIGVDLVDKVLHGQVRPAEHFLYTLSNLNVGTLTYNNALKSVATPAIQAQVNAIAAKIKSGQIKVPGNVALGQPGAAAKIDPKTIGC
jgi:basic membrane protein A